ncbi:putative E3 ubiquitin-protein ligase LIN isoform X2 [Tasmannia lanceolata]|uniref:putative E3 ubiquitin-protein ligase LIN isoform X2 n=1 Tax=Tasmannia lanceolata TaxID=3420 RepID=UPI004063BD1B
MASLQELLAEEGFRCKNSREISKPKNRTKSEGSVALPIYVCHNRKSIDVRSEKALRRNGSIGLSSKRVDSMSGRTNSNSHVSEDWSRDEPVMDEVAIRAVISILGGYVGRFAKDANFRTRIREVCASCLEGKKKNSENVVIVNLEMGINSIERLAENPEMTKEMKIRSLKNSIRLLSSVSSLNSSTSKSSKSDFTCGVPNSHLSACAQLYLSIVYKLQKNDQISATHLLQVFCDSPSLARKHLLSDLWEHFFLPHLLHLKVWYSKEVEFISESDFDGLDRRMKVLRKVYDDKMDTGTARFALYYKEWLKVGVKAPNVPTVSLPSRPSYEFSGKRSLSINSTSSVNKNLYQAVFGASFKREWADCEEDFLFKDGRDGLFTDGGGMVRGRGVGNEAYNQTLGNLVRSDNGGYHLSSINLYGNPRAESMSNAYKSDYFRFLSCRSEPTTRVALHSQIPKNEVTVEEPNTHISLLNICNAITTICNSDCLSNCEIAIRIVAKVWLDSEGDNIVETALSKEPVIEGMLEVLFSSEDDEILELAISLLAELVVSNEVNRQIILNSDPQLEIFMRLLRSKSLFVKAAVLLYLLKPKAKQMLSPDWVPLVLRVLEIGDRLQTMFTVQCRPQAAVFYFLHQLMTGFDIDRNVENAKQVILLGGLRLLIRELELGDIHERKNAASLLFCCIQADGSCRHYVANNIKKSSILDLLLGKQGNSGGCALSLLTELVSLNRTQINKFLNGLKNEGCLNTMHILLVYLHRAPIEQLPLVAAILLQLDLLFPYGIAVMLQGDPSQCSIYREEVIDAIIAALDCISHNEKIQEKSSRALLLLGGRFSYLGEPLAETWLLKQAGLDDVSDDPFRGKEIVSNDIAQLDEEENATQEWLRNAATVLLTSGNKRFLDALLQCITNGIPCLVRACLVTVAWMSTSLTSAQNSNLQLMACSILAPYLLQSLNYDRALEERVLASLSLLSFSKNSDCLSMLSPLKKELVGQLRSLTHVTWTAKELISILVENPSFTV